MNQNDEKYFKEAERIARQNSTCLKIKTGVIIVKDGKIVAKATNLCSPKGFHHGEKVKSCPRKNLPSGIRYDLCKPIHGELLAVLNAGKENCQGATMYLSGHYYACWHCESFARYAGIKEIKVKDLKAKKYYQERKIKLNKF